MIATPVDGTGDEEAPKKRFNKFNIGVFAAILLFLIALALLLMYPGLPSLIFYFVTSIPIIVIFIYYYIKRKKQSVYGSKP